MPCASYQCISARRAELSAIRTARLMQEMPLQALRQARQYSQETLAETLATSQSSISKLERRVDVYVSTLRRYVESMGGELEIVAKFPDGSVRINQLEDFGVANASSRKKPLGGR